MATKYDDEFYDHIEWKENQHGNSRPYYQPTDKNTGRFVSYKSADPFYNDSYPDDDSDDILNE